MEKSKRSNCYNTKVCIVGLGPAGIGAALTFLDTNLASDAMCLDAGNPSNDRVCSILQNRTCKKEEPCQIMSGIGGCSLFGGKISTLPAGSGFVSVLGSKDLAQKKLLQAFNMLNKYLHLQKPNITQSEQETAKELYEKMGFEYKYYDAYLYNQEELREVYHNVLLQLNSVGTTLLLNTKVIQIEYEENGFKLMAIRNGRKITIFTSYLVLGVGRLGHSFLKSLNSKFNLRGKENHIDIGVRIEFPTELQPGITKYHNDLKLLFDNARTFCVCKNGKIAPYFFEGMFFTEGYYNPVCESGLTNLGILLRLEPSKQNEIIVDDIKKKLLLLSGGKPVRQNLSDYLGGSRNCKSSKHFDYSISFWVQGDVNQCFPYFISTKIKEAVHHFTTRFLPRERWDEVSVFAPEVGYRSLAFPVNSDFLITPRMYLIGDCTGRFRGILQAFCSGVVCAESIIGDEDEKNL